MLFYDGSEEGEIAYVTCMSLTIVLVQGQKYTQIPNRQN